MPKKFKKCVKDVRKAEMKRYGYEKYNPYAVCRVSTGFYGSTKEKKYICPICKTSFIGKDYYFDENAKCTICRYKGIFKDVGITKKKNEVL